MSVKSIRFSGLASGIDTDAMVKAMLGNHQLKIDKQKQQQTLLEWKKDAWKDMNSQINTFYSKYVDKMRLRSTFNKTSVTVSNPNAIALDKNITIPEGNHSIEIKQMASGATVHTKGITKTGVTVAKTTQLTGEAGLGIEAGTKIAIGTKNIAAQEITISENMTIEGLETQLKAAVGIEVDVKFDAAVKGFIISSRQTGAESEINLSVVSGDMNAFKKLGIDEDGIGTFKGKNAKIIYNGGVTVESVSNNIEVNGLKFSLISETNEKIVISSTKDTEGIVSFIKGFVEEYNKLIEDINVKVNTERSRSYNPLSDEQKENMKESDITAWEKKIKDSLFSNDPQLKLVRDTMRGVLQDIDKERENYKSLADIGITTGSWKEMGKLYIDEDKLREVINKNPDSVVELFVGKTENNQITAKGIGNKLNESFQSMIKGINKVKSYGSFYHDIVDREKLVDVNKQVDKLQSQYTRLENMYYAKFTAMEKALSQLNSQSNWLAQQLGGMQR